MRYLSGDEIEDARNARGCGVPLERIARHLRISVDEFRQSLGLPTLRPIPEVEPRIDLWKVEQLNAVL